LIYERLDKYPDGQISARITDYTPPLFIQERINSYNDLMFVAKLANVLKRQKQPYYLEIPCLFGQRSDRVFAPNQSFDLEVIADVINNCKFDIVTLFDPHSNISPTLIKNSVMRPVTPYIERTIHAIGRENLVLVSPDAGAYKKIYDFAVDMKLPSCGALKHRDLNGNIDLQFIGNVEGKDCLIIDDLADGGYTFYLLSKKLKEQGARAVYLYVTHAMFFKGFDLLKEYITRIFCTNSYRDINDPYVTQYNIFYSK
jgi:ribose-phosphate pyrophosphokinase